MVTKRRRRPETRNSLAQGTPDWRWRTLPVWLGVTGGFVAGWYVAAFGAGWKFDSMAPVVVLWVVLAGFSFGLSRVISRYTAIWVAKRRGAKSEKRILAEPVTSTPRRSNRS